MLHDQACGNSFGICKETNVIALDIYGTNLHRQDYTAIVYIYTFGSSTTWTLYYSSHIQHNRSLNQ